MAASFTLEPQPENKNKNTTGYLQHSSLPEHSGGVTAAVKGMGQSFRVTHPRPGAHPSSLPHVLLCMDVPPFPLCPGVCFWGRPQRFVLNHSTMSLLIIQTPRRLCAQVLPKCVSGDTRDPSAMSRVSVGPWHHQLCPRCAEHPEPHKGRRVQGCGCSPAPLQLSSAPPSLLNAVLQIPTFLLHLGFFCWLFLLFFCVVQNSSLDLILGFCLCMIFACNLPYLSNVSPSAFQHTDVTKQQKKKRILLLKLPFQALHTLEAQALGWVWCWSPLG